MGKILFPQYFPNCPADGGDFIVPGYSDVITANVENTMKMFWRPKKIKISGSYTQFDETTRQCITPANFELIIQSPYASEEEMVCEPARQWTINSSSNVDDLENAFSWDSKPFYYGGQDALFTLNAFDFVLAPGVALRGGCVYKVLIKQLYAIEAGGGGPFDYQLINILGCGFNMATYVNELGIGYIQPSIEVTEWWSFGGTYDTTTGEPL